MAESWADQVARLRLMALGDPKWDLSPNDQAAITAALDKLSALDTERAAKRQFANALMGSACFYTGLGASGVHTPGCETTTYEAGRRHERNVYLEERATETARYERMRSAYNALAEELWKVADDVPDLADRIRRAFSTASRAYDAVVPSPTKTGA